MKGGLGKGEKRKHRHGAKLYRVCGGGKEGMGTRVVQLQAVNAQQQLHEGHCFGCFAAVSTAGRLCLLSALPTASLGRARVSGAPPGSQHPHSTMASWAGCWAQVAPGQR